MIIVLDTETSGLGSKDTILQLAYERYGRDGRLCDTFSAHIHPPFPYEIHEKAFEVHGLTKEFLLDNGYIRSQTVSMLTRLKRFASDGYLFIGHNFSFDLRLIRQSLTQYELPDISEIEYFCTQNDPRIRAFVDAKDVNGRLKSPNLGELYTKLFGAEIEGAHDALSDVRATARCYFELKRRGIV